jgi:hypothetical protein
MVLWAGAASPVAAATVTVMWDQNPEPEVNNYNVYVTSMPGNFGAPIPVGNRTNWTFTGLTDNVQYYFAVQAQSPSGLSSLSQISYLVPTHNSAGSEPSRSDFNGDGKFDLLWQNQQTGQLLAWHMNGAAVVGMRFLTPSSAGLEWKLRGSADFNNDGKPDLVFQNMTTGDVYFYLMDGTMAFTSGWFTPSKVDPTWIIAAVRDMDRDGYPDIVWYNTSTGQVLCNYMIGTTMVRQGWINANPLDTNWKLRGAADFNGDGFPDLLWQHEVTGQPLIWLMNGANATGSAMPPTPGNGAWKIRAVGDANMDGWPDLVFENSSTGAVVIWAMTWTGSNSVPYSGPYVGTVDPNWVISAPH